VTPTGWLFNTSFTFKGGTVQLSHQKAIKPGRGEAGLPNSLGGAEINKRTHGKSLMKQGLSVFTQKHRFISGEGKGR